MPPRIAIPMPHGSDPEYAERAIPQYERAVALAGGVPVRVPLDDTPEAITQLIRDCDGVLLPGSKADLDPARFKPIGRRTRPRPIRSATRSTIFCSTMPTSCASRC